MSRTLKSGPPSKVRRGENSREKSQPGDFVTKDETTGGAEGLVQFQKSDRQSRN